MTADPPLALALIGTDGAVERTTERWDGLLNGDAAKLEPYATLAFQGERVEVPLGAFTVGVEPVSDSSGARHALVTLACRPPSQRHEQLLRVLDASAAIGWLKDLAGRYVHVNRAYTETFSVSADDLQGRTDADLPVGKTVDGPRLREGAADALDPVQLEYSVAAFEGRPALKALRFPVRDERGEPVAICGIAVPAREAHVARAECGKLLEAELWERIPAAQVRTLMFEQWHLSTYASAGEQPPAPSGAAEEQNEQLRAAVAERDALVAAQAALQDDLAAERKRIDALHEASGTAARRAHELLSELAGEQTRTEELEHRLDEARARLANLDRSPDNSDRLDRELERAGATLAERQRQLTAAEHELAQSRASLAQSKEGLAHVREALALARTDAASAALRADEHRSRADQLESLVAELRERVERTERESEALARDSEAANGRLQALQDQLAGEEAERERLAAELALRAERLDGERAERERLAAELASRSHQLAATEKALADAQSAIAQAPVASASAADTPARWTMKSQLALTAALAGCSDWRSAVKETIKVVGSRQGWGAACVWFPEERLPSLRCAAMWTAVPDELAGFETGTWQMSPSLTGTELGRCLIGSELIWLTEIQEGIHDGRLIAAAGAGMRTAAYVPVRDGATGIGVLELLGGAAGEPSPEITDALEALGLQLGHLWRLYRTAAEPRWRLGRL